jgi:hypothetical protein
VINRLSMMPLSIDGLLEGMPLANPKKNATLNSRYVKPPWKKNIIAQWEQCPDAGQLMKQITDGRGKHSMAQ